MSQNVDVTPDRQHENMQRLAEVLNRLKCHLEIDPRHPETAVELPDDYFTATTLLRATIWNLRTVHGKLDVTFTPSGFPNGYEQLAASAQQRRISLTNVDAAIASLADVEHSKRVANRETDRDYLEAVKRPAPHRSRR